jgi:hypothetical protein
VSHSIAGDALGRLGRRAEAEPLLLTSLEEIRRIKGPRSPAAREATARVRSFYRSGGRDEEAERY